MLDLFFIFFVFYGFENDNRGCLPVARGGFFGLYIEMKSDRNSKASEA